MYLTDPVYPRLFYKQTHNCFIHQMILFLQTFKIPSLPKHQSQGADILKKCLPPNICHMSHATCHVSHVRCHVSDIMCHLSCFFFLFFFFFLDKVLELVGRVSIINRAYPVYFVLQKKISRQKSCKSKVKILNKRSFSCFSFIPSRSSDKDTKIRFFG